jgi:hypothetical protein
MISIFLLMAGRNSSHFLYPKKRVYTTIMATKSLPKGTIGTNAGLSHFTKADETKLKYFCRQREAILMAGFGYFCYQSTSWSYLNLTLQEANIYRAKY